MNAIRKNSTPEISTANIQIRKTSTSRSDAQHQHHRTPRPSRHADQTLHRRSHPLHPTKTKTAPSSFISLTPSPMCPCSLRKSLKAKARVEFTATPWKKSTGASAKSQDFAPRASGAKHLRHFHQRQRPLAERKWNGGSAGLLRDGKGGTWEGGYRVPAIALGPVKSNPAPRTKW